MRIEVRRALVTYQDYTTCYDDRVETGPHFYQDYHISQMCGMGSEVPARLGVWWEQSQGPSAFSFCVPGLTHVTLIELRPALILYQDYPMLLLTMARHCHMLQLIELRRALISYQD